MEGSEYFYFKNSPIFGSSPSGALHLLPIYDEYIMGYKDRGAYLKMTEHIEPKPNFAFFNTIVLDGQIVGIWKRVLHPKSIEFEYEFLQPLTQGQQLLFKKALERFGGFHNLPMNDEQRF